MLVGGTSWVGEAADAASHDELDRRYDRNAVSRGGEGSVRLPM